MFKVYSDNVLIADSRIDDLSIVNAIVTLEINTAGTFEFTLPSTHPRRDVIERLTSVVRVERDNKLVFQGVCTEESIDFYGNRKVMCEGELTYFNDSILRPAKYQGETVLSLLTKYINQHNAQVEERKQFYVGNVTVTDPNDYIYCFTNMNSTMQEIKEDLIDDYGGYLRVRYANGNKYIDYLAESTKQATQTIELGKNLINYQSNINDTDIATRVIPLGATLEEQVIEGLDTRLDIKSVNSGLDYLQSNQAINNFGIITKVVTFDDVTTPSILKTKGQAYLNEVQFENVVIEVSAVDFGMITNRVDTFELLDNIHVISQPHGMDRWFTLTKMVLNLNNPESDVFTLGKNQKIGLATKTNNTIRDLTQQLENLNMDSWLLKAKQQATALISGANGGFVVLNVNDDGEPFELLVMDRDSIETATKVWRWNQNGFGYSSTGYHGTYGTAITMDGVINADYIKAGQIKGIQFLTSQRTQLNEDVQGLYIGNDGFDFCFKLTDYWVEEGYSWVHFTVTLSSLIIKVRNEEVFKVDPSTRVGGGAIGAHVTIPTLVYQRLIQDAN